jgi:MFS family permease
MDDRRCLFSDSAVFVRRRPQAAESSEPAQRGAAPALPGLEVAQALRGRTFWLISFMYLMWSVCSGGLIIHTVPYWNDLGYKPAQTAFALGALLFFAAVGKPIMGAAADRIGVRWALTMAFAVECVGYAILPKAISPFILVVFVVGFGLSFGVPLALIPVLGVECFGIRRFGTLSGLLAISALVGGSAGPVLAGHIYDPYGSYLPLFVMSAIFLLCATALPLACLPQVPEVAADQALASA